MYVMNWAIVTIGLYFLLIYLPVDWVLRFEIGDLHRYPKHWIRTAILLTTRTRVCQVSGTTFWQVQAKALYITPWRIVQHCATHSGYYQLQSDADNAKVCLDTAIAKAIRASQ